MKINPIAIFTTLAIAAAGTAGYVAFKPAQIAHSVAVVAAPTPEVITETPKVETEVAIVAAPLKQPEPAPAPAPVIAPSFDSVRIETGGEAVIAGRAEPETEVVAKLDGIIIATALATADGSFVMIPTKPLPAGAGTLSLETKKGGMVQVSSATIAVAVKSQGQGESTVAVLAPDQPTKVLQAPASPSNAVVLDAVDYNAAGAIVFTGRGLPGAAVRLYVDNVIAGEVKADDGGKWTYAGTAAVTAGTHTLRADALAADGTVASRVEVPFLREQPAKVAETATAEVPVAPAAPAIATAPKIEVGAAQPKRIVIQPGNNLWTISREIYGYGKNYTVIYEANKDQIRNPRLIYPGQIITAPVAETAP
jgi:nucleoid-associated protein YgaU